MSDLFWARKGNTWRHHYFSLCTEDRKMRTFLEDFFRLRKLVLIIPVGHRPRELPDDAKDMELFRQQNLQYMMWLLGRVEVSDEVQLSISCWHEGKEFDFLPGDGPQKLTERLRSVKDSSWKS
ncbi:MAG: hypothetical protein M1820_006868 [Bogoriella megaspora]|nr:MAG: hypothetical protein M1820_006868 [Bogoriella megaspora]